MCCWKRVRERQIKRTFHHQRYSVREGEKDENRVVKAAEILLLTTGSHVAAVNWSFSSLFSPPVHQKHAGPPCRAPATAGVGELHSGGGHLGGGVASGSS
ncbi:hypothetical protein HispidOSU_003163 [Sigmodon hispidus]